jgi:ribose-phosphate pyrophosphokinase
MIVLEGAVATPLTTQVARHLNVSPLYVTIARFPGHEWSVHIAPHHVANQHVIIVHGIHAPPDHQPLSGRTNETISLHDALMASLCIARKAKQQNPQTVTMLCPFMPYGRQDKEGILSFRAMLFDMMRASSIDRIITLDLHDAVECIPSFVSCPNSIPLWKPFFQNMPDLTIVATDKGGQERAQMMAQALKTPTPPLFLEKERLPNGSCTINVPNTPCPENHFLVLDDIMDTGSTLCNAIDALKKRQSGAFFSVCITHGLWSQDCVEKIKTMDIDKIFISDSITCHTPLPSNIHVVPCASLLAHTIAMDPFYHTQQKTA